MMLALRRKILATCLLGMGASAVIIGQELLRYGVGQDVRLQVGAAGMLLLLLAAAGVVWSYRRNVQAGLRLLGRQLREIRSNEHLPHLLVESSQPGSKTVRPLATSVDELRREMDELRSRNCSLDVQYRIADARRRQAETILKRSSDAVLVVNRFHELIFANDTAAETLGFSCRTAMRRKVEEILEDSALVRELGLTREATGAAPQRVVEVACHLGDQPRSFRVLLQRLESSIVGSGCVAMTLQDISSRNEAERAQSEFVSNVSHELKTPLASIKAYTEMLLDGDIEDPRQKRQCYATMARETDRLANMIERLLSLSRLQSMGCGVPLEPVSMTAVLRQVLGVLAPQAAARQLNIQEKLPPVFCQVEADHDMLCQAMMNLIGNAIKYTEPGGEIRVMVTPDKKREIVTVEIADSGIGIAAEELPRIFEKFYRVRSTKHMASGSGLGLSLTKYIIEAIHHSQLSVTSELGEGTTFSFQLPMVL